MRRRCSRLTVLSGSPSSFGGVIVWPFHGGVKQRAAVFELELFGATEGDFQTVGEIVGNMITTDREHARMFDDAIGINHVLGGPTANIDDQRAEFFCSLESNASEEARPLEDHILGFKL